MTARKVTPKKATHERRKPLEAQQLRQVAGGKKTIKKTTRKKAVRKKTTY